MPERQMHLGVFVLGTGNHVAGWRYPGAFDTFQSLPVVQAIARTAERGRFDLLFLGDGLAADPANHPSFTTRLEPVTMLAALAATTTHVGLGATASTTYGEPFHTARVFATLDHLSHGRAAWNVVTTSYARSAANFTRGEHPPHDERYAIAEEFVDICKGLWDSWEDGAFVMDKARGVFAEGGALHTLNHAGKYFSVKGPLNVSRPPQGHPVIIQAGSSGPGQDLAARTADVVFTAQGELEEAQVFYRGLKARMRQAGRDPASLHVMPGVFPVVGRTEAAARALYDQLKEWTDLGGALALLTYRLGHDVSGLPLDEPLPELPESDQLQSRAKLLTAKARREGMTVRELALHVGMARGHRIVSGTAAQVADALEEWFAGEAADGFNVMPPYFPGAFDDFVDLVVPELQRRGLFRREYEGTTLRENLGLERPGNTFLARAAAE